ncbi:MAG: hypothetical protein EP344_08635 [Bacteroidetes bacterium]|nr:MAG: hypothetical protein EP344_08635 [Bacteroidota bacterium]
MRNLPLFLFALLTCVSCRTVSKSPTADPDPLPAILAAQGPALDSILQKPEVYEVQVIYTKIDRDRRQRPHFTSYFWNVDSTRYFYPASMVKMPLALLALEQINHLRNGQYPGLSKELPYRLDSVRVWQQPYDLDPEAPGGRPSIAHDIRKIFLVSDNLAYNHLFEFLGREHINTTLQKKGYTRTGIVHRFNTPARDNRFSSPITFLGPDFLLHQPERFDTNTWENPQHHLVKGRGYIDNRDSLVSEPFDFSTRNWFALTDMERMLRAVIFPESVPEQNRFDLTEADYHFLWHYMGIFPRECDYPVYDSTRFWDGYSKFFLWGDTRDQQSGSIRVFNKIGEAYGYLTDVAYIADIENQVEFILAATIHCNSDGIYNDDQYDYRSVGYPFLARLGRAVLEYEYRRTRRVVPDLTRFRKAINVSR